MFMSANRCWRLGLTALSRVLVLQSFSLLLLITELNLEFKFLGEWRLLLGPADWTSVPVRGGTFQRSSEWENAAAVLNSRLFSAVVLSSRRVPGKTPHSRAKSAETQSTTLKGQCTVSKLDDSFTRSSCFTNIASSDVCPLSNLTGLYLSSSQRLTSKVSFQNL